MKVRVRLFGMLKEIYGRDSEVLELPIGADLSSVVEHYLQLAPERRELFPSLALSVNYEYQPVSHLLNDGDEVGLLPPVSGGAEEEPESMHCRIVRQPIATQEIVAGLKQGSDGALVVFDGIVRDNTRGRKTLYLEYSSYEVMAIKQMEGLVEQVLEQFAIRDARIVHRLGRLEIGETSVLIAVASAHRAAAFDASRFLIDTLKKTVPIWKKEFFEDGAVWADGEPFPPEVHGMRSGRARVNI